MNEEESEGNFGKWNHHETFGNCKPKPISHHTSVVYDNKMYLYGGSYSLENNKQFFALDLNSLNWEVIKN